jgi:hypothetical protein
MKWFRHRYPRTFPFAMGGLGGLAGWGIALVARHMSFPWGPAVIVVFCLIVMRMCWAEVQDMQRRIKILQLVQQAAVTQDEALFEAALLEMKYLDSPGRRLDAVVVVRAQRELQPGLRATHRHRNLVVGDEAAVAEHLLRATLRAQVTRQVVAVDAVDP